jgi:CheY-like chemotaxis protein
VCHTGWVCQYAKLPPCYGCSSAGAVAARGPEGAAATRSVYDADLVADVIRVVVVDDQADFLEWACGVLGADARFAVVASFTDPEEALPAVLEIQPDLMLVDFEMPGTSGFEMARRVTQAAPDVQILLMSLHDSSYLKTLARRSGARGFLPKQQFAPTAVLARLRDGNLDVVPNAAGLAG